MVLTLPAASAPPASVTTSRRTGGRPRAASSMVGIVVTSRSSMILGLVRANSERATTRTERRPARAGSAFAVAGVTICPPYRHAVRTSRRPARRRLEGSHHPAAPAACLPVPVAAPAAGARSLCPGTVCGLVYRKYKTVATTRNRATGIAKVMIEAARVQSLPTAARFIATAASCESTRSPQPGPGRPGRLMSEQPIEVGRRSLGFVFAEPSDRQRDGHDAERHQRDHPQDRPTHLLVGDGVKDMMTEAEVGRVRQPRAVDADQPEHRAGRGHAQQEADPAQR